MSEQKKSSNNSKIKLAVFDFDGTIIPSQSGVKMATELIKSNYISKTKAIKLIFWGFRYKAHLPYKERTSRELIFMPFAGKKAEEVDAYFDEFYKHNLDATVRPRLMEIAKQLKQNDVELIVLSAAFTSTLKSFSQHRGFVHFVGTEMEVDENGCYTGKVDGECVAGEEKLERLFDYADKTFGKDNWEIEYAFADHYTDRDLLKAANYVCCIDPDDTLKRYAKKHDWEIMEFEKKEEKKIQKEIKKTNKIKGTRVDFGDIVSENNTKNQV